MKRHALKGDCTPKSIQKAGHPWRRPVWFHAGKNGSYVVDEARIERRIARAKRT